MALLKLLTGNGKVGEVSSTDLIEQPNEGRAVTAGGLALAGSGPTHQWLMNDGTPATTVADTGTGTAVDFDSNTAVTSTTGITGFGSALAVDFNGSTAELVTSGVASTDFTTGPWTWVFWVNLDVLKATGLVNIRDGSENIVDIGMNGTGTIFTGVNTAAGFKNAGNSTDALSTGTWSMVTISFTDTAITQNINDGATTDSFGFASTTMLNAATASLKLGSVVSVNFLDGQMDAVYFFDHEISGADRTALYASGAPTEEDITVAPAVNGDFVYLTLGKVSPADASDETKAEVSGFYEDTNDSVATKRGSEITGFNVQTAITMATDDTAYLSASEPGKITNVAPTTQGHSVVKLGKMEDASTLILDIEFEYIN
jgi:hypothetical protein